MNPDSNDAADQPNGLAELNEILTVILHVAAILVMAGLVLDVVWGVVTRYVFGQQARWTEELAKFLLIWVSLLGGAVAYRNREHLGIDFLVTKLDSEVSKGTKLFTEILSCLVVVLVLIVGGTQLVAASWRPTPALGWPMGLVYLIIPVVGFLMLSFSVEYIMANWKPDTKPPAPTEE